MNGYFEICNTEFDKDDEVLSTYYEGVRFNREAKKERSVIAKFLLGERVKLNGIKRKFRKLPI